MPSDADRFRFLADHKLTLHTNGEHYMVHFCRTQGPGKPPIYYPVSNGSSAEDWLNDMDLRDIIAGALEVAGEEQRAGVSARLERADDLFKKSTVVTGPLWGKSVAASHSHDPARTWWYFRRPRNPGETLNADLEAAGIS